MKSLEQYIYVLRITNTVLRIESYKDKRQKSLNISNNRKKNV